VGTLRRYPRLSKNPDNTTASSPNTTTPSPSTTMRALPATNHDPVPFIRGRQLDDIRLDDARAWRRRGQHGDRLSGLECRGGAS
jgi:hypothetical protein